MHRKWRKETEIDGKQESPEKRKKCTLGWREQTNEIVKKVENREDRSQSNAVVDTLPTGDNGRQSRSY